MAKALKCDRCGGFYDLLTESRNYRIRDFSEPIKYEKYVDLCPDCYAEFLLFLDLDDNGSVGSSDVSREFEPISDTDVRGGL